MSQTEIPSEWLDRHPELREELEEGKHEAAPARGGGYLPGDVIEGAVESLENGLEKSRAWEASVAEGLGQRLTDAEAGRHPGPLIFQEFKKIPRLSREMIVTEKIDGTNAQVTITEDGLALAGSRHRFITPEDDNFGFARWVEENREPLLALGPGTHFGEWWGAGIQRRYDLKEKRFSLFNVTRWGDETIRPACCHVVPVLYQGPFRTQAVEECLDMLRVDGSRAARGFMRPEGVVVFHAASGYLFKKTLERDEEPKGRKS